MAAPSAARLVPPATPPSAGDLARAARLLVVRSRRDATGLFAGAYTSAFRGGGVEFDELVPYTPGDDVRNLDWNATARTGEPYVKRFREERDQTLLVVLDVSASMAFHSTGSSKVQLGAHAAGLLMAAAGRAGDRVGLLAFAEETRAELRPDRGTGHTWLAVRTAAEAAAACGGVTDLGGVLGRALRLLRRRSVLFVLSDFRGHDDRLPPELEVAARRHDLVAGVLHDRREATLPDVGTLRVRDPERPGATRLLHTGSPAVRARYAAAGAARRRELERRLRGAGAEPLWLATDRDPLPALVRFFRARAGRLRRGP